MSSCSHWILCCARLQFPFKTAHGKKRLRTARPGTPGRGRGGRVSWGYVGPADQNQTTRVRADEPRAPAGVEHVRSTLCFAAQTASKPTTTVSARLCGVSSSVQLELHLGPVAEPAQVSLTRGSLAERYYTSFAGPPASSGDSAAAKLGVMTVTPLAPQLSPRLFRHRFG